MEKFCGGHGEALVAMLAVSGGVAVGDDGGVQGPGDDDGAVDDGITRSGFGDGGGGEVG